MNKKILKMIFSFFIVLFMILINAPCAHAEFMIRPFKGSASITESIYYDSNPGRADFKGNRDASMGNRLGLDLALELPFGELHKYSFNSSTAWSKYFSNDAEGYDNVSSKLSHSLDLVFNKWSLNIHHNFDATDEPEGAELSAVDNNRGVFRKEVQYPGFVVRGDLGKLKLALGGDYQNYRTNSRYDELERDVYSGFIEAGAQITPLLDGFFRYTYTDIERLDPMYNSSQGHDLRLGMRGELTPYLAGEVAAGYAMVYFEDTNPFTPGFTGWGDSSDYEGVVFSGSLTNRLSRLTTQKFSFSYEPEVGYNVGNYYSTFIGMYNIDHQLNDKINLHGLAQYIYSKESGGVPRFKEDYSEVLQFGGGIAYAVGKNIDLIADYTYTEKDSEARAATAKDYIQHEASVGARYTF